MLLTIGGREHERRAAVLIHSPHVRPCSDPPQPSATLSVVQAATHPHTLAPPAPARSTAATCGRFGITEAGASAATGALLERPVLPIATRHTHTHTCHLLPGPHVTLILRLALGDLTRSHFVSCRFLRAVHSTTLSAGDMVTLAAVSHGKEGKRDDAPHEAIEGERPIAKEPIEQIVPGIIQLASWWLVCSGALGCSSHHEGVAWRVTLALHRMVDQSGHGDE